MKMKKTLLGAFLGMFALAGFAVLPNFVSAQDEGTTDQGTTDQGTTDQGTTDQGTTDQGTTDQGNTETTTEIQAVNTNQAGGTAYGQTAQGGGDWVNPDPGVSYLSNQKLTGSAFLSTIKNAINWILGILATIALVICLYGGFLMVTAAGDEKKYQKGLSVLKYAAIGLAIIGLSWMIVSIIFWFVAKLGGNKQTGQEAVKTQFTDDSAGTSLRANSSANNANGGYQATTTTY